MTVERKWNGSAWVVTGGGAEKHNHVTFSATEPVSPDAGDVWINPDESLSDSHLHTEYQPVMADSGWLALDGVVEAWGTGVGPHGSAIWHPYIRKIGTEVILRGLITCGSALSSGALLFRLPSQYRPWDAGLSLNGHHIATATGNSPYTEFVRVEVGGDVDTGQARDAGEWVSMDALRWRTD